MIAAIGERPGSATAFKAIIRSGKEYEFRRNDKWSDEERGIIEAIDGKSIDGYPLVLRKRQRETVERIPLWIGPRKFGKDQSSSKYGKRFLRVATFNNGSPAMKRLLDDAEIGQ